MSMKRTLAIVAAAAMMMAQPLTTLAATPGDNLTPQFEIHDAGTTATVDFSNQTSGTTTAPAATQAPVNTVVPAGTTAPDTVLPGAAQTTTDAAAATTGMTASTGNKILPKINPVVETIRPYMTVDSTGDMQADPVLNLIPLATYFIKDANGNRMPLKQKRKQ